MSRYFRRRWAESRGDAYDSWGPATYFFETTDTGEVVRQVEVYENGPVLRYEPERVEDEYGGRSSSPLDLGEFDDFASTAEDFEQVWQA